jgi:hypothetical protein
MITLGIHLFRHCDNGEGAGGNAYFTAFAPFDIDLNITFDLSHKYIVELLTDSQGEITKLNLNFAISPFHHFAI